MYFYINFFFFFQVIFNIDPSLKQQFLFLFRKIDIVRSIESAIKFKDTHIHFMVALRQFEIRLKCT